MEYCTTFRASSLANRFLTKDSRFSSGLSFLPPARRRRSKKSKMLRYSR